MIWHRNSVVDGFTLTRGRGSMGGGAYIENGSLRDSLVISNSVAGFGGGGLYCNRNATVSGCTIRWNRALSGADGGGVYSLLNNSIRNSRIQDNSARVGGGLVSLFHTIVENCVISGNTADQGGGISCSQYSVIRHCTVADNSAQVGGGINTFYGGEVLNSVVYFNTAATGSNWYDQGSEDTAAVYHWSCTAPAVSGEGNINSDPLFTDRTSGLYTLTGGSPCIDSASATVFSTNDITGLSRPVDGNDDSEAVADMGAFEYAP